MEAANIESLDMNQKYVVLIFDENKRWFSLKQA